MNRERILVIAEIGLAVALAAALHNLRIYQAPQGGTVSLEMAPILVVALRRGLGVGVLTGALFGLVDILLEPFGVAHPIQAVLDFPLAFGLVGLAGVFSGRWQGLVTKALERQDPGAIYKGQMTALLPAALLGAALRGVAHVVSGAIFFASYAPVGQSAWVYSLIYNGAYLLPSAAICAVALWVTQPALESAVPLRRVSAMGGHG
jgi:thiamine transporter